MVLVKLSQLKIPMPIYFLFFAIVTLVASIISACGGGSANQLNGNQAKLTRPPVSSTLNLRLGQTSTSTSPVAVSAALESGENITIFSKQEGKFSQFSAVYQGLNGSSLYVTFDQSGRPISAETIDAVVSFSNYTATTVDITITTTSGSQSSRIATQVIPGVAIDPEVTSFLDGDILLEVLLGINQDIDSGTRSLLAFAFSALRVVGCSTDNALSIFSSIEGFIPEIFQSISKEVCDSPLLSTIQDKVLTKSDYSAITVTELSIPSPCFIPETLTDLFSCATDLGKQLVAAAAAGITGNISQLNPAASPSPSASPSTGTSASPSSSVSSSASSSPSRSASASPSPSMSRAPMGDPRRGSWSGIGTPMSQVTGCNSFYIDFNITDQGDISCGAVNPQLPCLLSGTFNEQSEFPNFVISGIMDSMGNMAFAGSAGSITVEGNAILSMNTSVGTFSIMNLGSCDGTISLNQSNG